MYYRQKESVYVLVITTTTTLEKEGVSFVHCRALAFVSGRKGESKRR